MKTYQNSPQKPACKKSKLTYHAQILCLTTALCAVTMGTGLAQTMTEVGCQSSLEDGCYVFDAAAPAENKLQDTIITADNARGSYGGIQLGKQGVMGSYNMDLSNVTVIVTNVNTPMGIKLYGNTVVNLDNVTVQGKTNTTASNAFGISTGNGTYDNTNLTANNFKTTGFSGGIEIKNGRSSPGTTALFNGKTTVDAMVYGVDVKAGMQAGITNKVVFEDLDVNVKILGTHDVVYEHGLLIASTSVYGNSTKGKAELVVNRGTITFDARCQNSGGVCANKPSTSYYSQRAGVHLHASNGTVDARLNDTIINIYGERASGIRLDAQYGAPGSAFLIGSNVHITTNDKMSYGVLSLQNAESSLIDGSSIKTLGEMSHGVVVQGAENIFTLTDGTVETEAAYSLAAYAGQGGNIVLTDSIVTTKGSGSHALTIANNDSINGGISKITLNRTNVTTKGENASIIWARADAYKGPAQFNITDSILVAEQGYGISAQNWVEDGAYYGEIGDGPSKDSSANINLNGVTLKGQKGLYNFSTKYDSPYGRFNPNTAILTIDAKNSELYGAGIMTSLTPDKEQKKEVTYSLSENSKWFIDGDSEATTLNNSNSTITFVNEAYNFKDDPSSYTNFRSLKVTGNYTGDNGTIVFNTKLGDDTSPTDILYIGGDAIGTTNVNVRNAAGTGALTTGDGIKLIDITGDSPDTAFVLKSDSTWQGRDVVVGGAYVYTFEHGGSAATGGDIADGNWYLRSVYNGPAQTPDDAVFQPGAPLYEVYPQILLQLNRLGTLQQRVGNRVWLNEQTDDVANQAADTVEGRGFWMRVEGSTGHINPHKSTTHADYDLDMIRTQFGLDFVAKETDDGTLIGGLYGQYGHARADVSSRYGTGSISTDAYGLGATLTWYGRDDVYIDGQAQVMWFDSKLRSRRDPSGRVLDKDLTSGNDGLGYTFGVEIGKKYQVNSDWAVTPQLQIVYNGVEFDTFHDIWGSRTSLQDGDSLISRAGISFDRERTWQDESGAMRRLKSYGIANLYYEFFDGTKIDLSNVTLSNEMNAFWGGIGGGFSYNWKDDSYSFYGEADARSAFADFGSTYTLNGTIGFRAKF